jgi:hypothetical protein
MGGSQMIPLTGLQKKIITNIAEGVWSPVHRPSDTRATLDEIRTGRRHDLSIWPRLTIRVYCKIVLKRMGLVMTAGNCIRLTEKGVIAYKSIKEETP